MSRPPNESIARSQILNKTKRQYEPGPMRPKLCLMLKETGEKTSSLKLRWMYYAGMGDVDFSPLSKKVEKNAAKQLIKEGYLVPMQKDNIYGVTHFQHLKHFDDVNWGRTKNGDFIIYDLSDNIHQPQWPDMVIRPDAQYDAAIEMLKSRIEYEKTWEDAPLTLKDGTRITPILTDESVIKIRKRQTQKMVTSIPTQP